MLVLSRHRDQEIHIGDDIVIKIVRVRDGKVRLAITAPKEMKVYRKEVLDRIKEEKAKTDGDSH